MLTKIALTALVIGLAILLLFRGRRSSRPERPDPQDRLPRPIALVQCPDCGTHHLPGRPCGCGGTDRG